MRIRRFTFHVVWLTLTIAALCSVFRGPFWGYPIAIFLAFIFSVIVAGYPSDNSLRWMLGGFGALLAAGGLTTILPFGLTAMTIHGSLPLLLVGFACVWSASLPWGELDVGATTSEMPPRTFPSDGPPCPKCSKPLRTQKSLQCFHCGADWH